MGGKENPVSNQPVVNPQNAVTAAPDASVMTPDAMVDQLRALRTQIPEYVQLSPVDRKSRVPLTSLNRDFAQAAISAIGASPKVEALVGQSPENLQGDIETANRWSMSRMNCGPCWQASHRPTWCVVIASAEPFS
jgi:hypothetical protein